VCLRVCGCESVCACVCAGVTEGDKVPWCHASIVCFALTCVRKRERKGECVSE